MAAVHQLVLVLGDQLDRKSAAFDGFDAEQDAVWMAETHEEATHVWCHKLRLAYFFSSMRHFRDDCRDRDISVHYHELGEKKSEDRGRNFAEILKRDLRELKPDRLVVVEPGDHRVLTMLADTADASGVSLEMRDDTHFYCGINEFREYSADRGGLILEHFYRRMRRKHDVLMHANGKPVGGKWNFDKDNRESFGKLGPGDIKRPRRFRADGTTQRVIDLVRSRFAGHPGSLDHFDLPVTRSQALALLRDFIEHRLPRFGTFQDAMWSGEHFVYHSRLSAALNSHLLAPRECVDKAIEAYEEGHAELNSVEGFVRQLLGWREFVRGVYWLHMPDYLERNALRCDDVDVPQCFWDGDTDMNCVRQTMRNVVDHGYAHHIQRLMVLGLLALLLGVHPRRFHEWHMAMYVDAVDWVSLPNTMGMSQYGDGGIVGTKPYCATGKYIRRMSNYCAGCEYRPEHATSGDACPFTALYWDFLARHEQLFAGNSRMAFQTASLGRKDAEELKAIREKASEWRNKLLSS